MRIHMSSAYHCGTYFLYDQLKQLIPGTVLRSENSAGNLTHRHPNHWDESFKKELFSPYREYPVVIAIRNPILAYNSVIWRRFGTKANYISNCNDNKRHDELRKYIGTYLQQFNIPNAFMFTWELANTKDKQEKLIENLRSYLKINYPDNYYFNWSPKNITSIVMQDNKLRKGLTATGDIGRVDFAFFSSIKEAINKHNKELYRKHFEIEYQTFERSVILKSKLESLGYKNLWW